MNANTDLERTTHPLRGVLWGIPFGLGLALLLVTLKVIALSVVSMLAVFVIGIILAAAWSVLGPAKRPSGGAAPTRTPDSIVDDATDSASTSDSDS